MAAEDLCKADKSRVASQCLPGNIVKCTTCLNVKRQGEVVAYDWEKNLILLKLLPSSGKAGLNDVLLVNMKYLEKMEVIKETTITPSSLSALNSSKLLDRFKEEVSRKRRLAKARSDGVSSDGVMLYTYLRKVMPIKSIKWAGQSILVMDEVTVNPPYNSDNCVTRNPNLSNTQCLNHVKKTVERFHKEEKLKRQLPGST